MHVPGEMDKLSLEEAGFTNVVSVPSGAPDEVKNGPLPEHSADKAFEYVWNCWEELQPASCILLGTDNDLPGHALAEELARRLGTCCMLLIRSEFAYIAAAQAACSRPLVCTVSACLKHDVVIRISSLTTWSVF